MRVKKSCRKRLMSLLLAGVLAVSALPDGIQVQAAESEPVTITTEKDVYV